MQDKVKDKVKAALDWLNEEANAIFVLAALAGWSLHSATVVDLLCVVPFALVACWCVRNDLRQRIVMLETHALGERANPCRGKCKQGPVDAQQA